MRSLSKGWRRLFAVGLLGVAAALAALYFPRERLLLQRATRVAHLDDGNYFWLPGQDILLSRDEDRSYNLSRLHLKTGQKTPLIALGRLLDKSFAGSSEYVSPDGQWLLWTDYENGAGIYGASLDGLNQVHVPENDIDDIFWMPDSRHWIELLRDDKDNVATARVRGVDDPHFVQRLCFPTALSLSDTDITITPQAHLLLLTYSSDLLLNTPVADYSTVRLTELDLHASVRLLRTFPVHGPKGVLVCQCSPQGNRIAWLRLRVSEYSPPTILLWLNRLLSRFEVPQSQLTVALWISRLNGSQMREIGHIVMKPGDVETPYQIQWAPDGKRLSFIYKGALYTVPAD